MRWDDAKYFPSKYLDTFDRYQMKEGDIVIALDRPVVGAGLKCSPVRAYDLPCLLVQRVARLRAKHAICQSYLTQVVQTSRFIAHLLNRKTETAVPHVSPNDIRNYTISLPKVEEQRRIAQVLETWDKAIAITEQFLANSRKQKQALTQGLLSGKHRLHPRSKWAKKKLSALIVESRLPGSRGGVAKKITVKLYGKGVVAKEERRAGSDATQYYKRKAGQFIYSKLDFLNGAFGLIPAELDGYESTLDLPAFDFLDDVDPRWFLYYVSREEFYLGHLGLANGGRKARRVNPSDLLNVVIEVPDVAEQRVIADAVDTAVSEETAWARMAALLRTQKQALMADLLTGKRRVRLPEPVEEAAA